MTEPNISFTQIQWAWQQAKGYKTAAQWAGATDADRLEFLRFLDEVALFIERKEKRPTRRSRGVGRD